MCNNALGHILNQVFLLEPDLYEFRLSMLVLRLGSKLQRCAYQTIYKTVKCKNRCIAFFKYTSTTSAHESLCIHKLLNI